MFNMFKVKQGDIGMGKKKQRQKIQQKQNDEQVEAFLEELGELCKRYGFRIDGCGCCGSPWVSNGAPQNYTADYVDSDVLVRKNLTPN